MTHWIPAFAVLVACLLLAGCARHYNDAGLDPALPDNGYRELREQQFSPPDWPQALFADVYIPNGEREGRSRDDMTGISRRLADRGFVAVKIDYRFAPEFRFPAQVHDVQVALAWMRTKAERLRIDPDRIAGLGYSSGAHLVALAGLVAGTDSPLNEEYGPEDQGFFAVVAGGIPSDFSLFNDGRLIRQLIGAPRAEAPEAYRAAAPIEHVHAEVLHEALLGHGVHSELYRMRLRGHLGAYVFRGGAVRQAMIFMHAMADGEEGG